MVGKKAIDYENTPITFYRFVCNDSDIVSSYVGHTVSFRRRKSGHKNSCLTTKQTRNSGLKIYQTIRDNGGWDNWKMIEIEKRICIDKRDCERYEQKLIEDLQANMNMNRAYRTGEQKKDQLKEQDKKYYKQNKDRILERAKMYYEKNKSKILEQSHQRYLEKKNI